MCVFSAISIWHKALTSLRCLHRSLCSEILWWLVGCVYVYMLARSRLADFLNNCHPSPLKASSCLKDSVALCLRAYAGLIGTGSLGNGLEMGDRLKCISYTLLYVTNQCMKLEEIISTILFLFSDIKVNNLLLWPDLYFTYFPPDVCMSPCRDHHDTKLYQ